MSDHYLEQLRHQLDQTRADLRRAEDELAVHRQRVSRETRLRLAWQSARRRANWQRAILADYRTEADARSLAETRDAASAPEQAATIHVRYVTPVIKCERCDRALHPGYACGETNQYAQAVRAALDDAFAKLTQQPHLGAAFTAPAPQAEPHECRIWEDKDGEWNVICTACPEYRYDMGSEHDCEVWADDHAAAAGKP